MKIDGMSDEVWRPVPDYPAYGISNTGFARSLFIRGSRRKLGSNFLPLKLRNNHGYKSVMVYNESGSSVIFVHRLVASLFIGPIPEGKIVAHLDGNPANNSCTNLMFATMAENQGHRILHGTDCRGGKNGQSRLSEEDVIAIRSHTKRRGLLVDLARRYGVSSATIHAVIARTRWSHVQ